MVCYWVLHDSGVDTAKGHPIWRRRHCILTRWCLSLATCLLSRSAMTKHSHMLCSDREQFARRSTGSLSIASITFRTKRLNVHETLRFDANIARRTENMFRYSRVVQEIARWRKELRTRLFERLGIVFNSIGAPAKFPQTTVDKMNLALFTSEAVLSAIATLSQFQKFWLSV